ncbi:zinc finger protein 782 [Scaptodrosophila lebanonensis]|uniref:Zinc finger protein 782 n=1 Tax=Drosophila lebanonensis TaxID=7225 RepID=A0A6J2U2W1_DROLE|nr:zinc finger protein 782 [Scaptodrosophila lebanonensis]
MPPDVQITSDSDLESVLQDFKLRQTRRDSTGPKYTCSIAGCDEKFKRLDQLDRHEYHHTGVKKHACFYDGCDKIYTIITHLKRHLRTTHERPDSAAQKTVKCALEECDKMFTSASNMQRHVREAHEHPREYSCAYCEAKFTQKLKLRRHEITKHTQDYPYRCGKCSRGFYQKWQQESHERSCKLYSCDNCTLKFEKWSQYQRHCRLTQHGRNRHKCGHCDRCYDKPSDLSKHVIAKHSKEGDEMGSAIPFVCKEPNCTRAYAYERNLRQHVLTAHVGKRFECQAVNCGRCFSSAQNMAKHLKRDHPNTGQVQKLKEEPPPKKIKRKQRKDAGKPIKSNLSKLSGLVLEKEVDGRVRARDVSILDNVARQLELQMPQPLTEDEEVGGNDSEDDTDKDEMAIEKLLTETLQDEEEVV